MTCVILQPFGVQVGCPDKVREAPLALKAIYDADLAEEDIILAWHARKDAAKVLGVPADGAAAGMTSEDNESGGQNLWSVVAPLLHCMSTKQAYAPIAAL